MKNLLSLRRGVFVVQTSDDPEVVAALHTHAVEVTAMTERGMRNKYGKK